MLQRWRQIDFRLFSTERTRHTVVALSGGVDSAVAMGLLLKNGQQQQQQQHKIVKAIHMTNWNADDDDSITTCQEQDWRDATAVAKHYGVSIVRKSFEQDYWHSVFVPYLQDLSQKHWMGNPDVACNIHVKFGSLRQYVQKHYGDDTWLATGHYARLWRRHEIEEWMEEQKMMGYDNIDWVWNWGGCNERDDLPLLVAAVDPSKDQSYFLSGCKAEQLSRVVFPLGNHYKSQVNESESSEAIPSVRQLAADWQLPVANKRDSVGICFIGKRKGGFRSFLGNYYEPTGPNVVNLVDVDTSKVIGKVDALTAQAATPGQGAKVSGSPTRYFVVGRCQDDDSKIFVCAGTHHSALYADSIILAQDMSWVMPEIPAPLRNQGHMRVQCRIRHLQPLVNATLTYDSTSTQYSLSLDRPLRGITPGQRAVMYVNGICLGGASIGKAGPSYLERSLDLPCELHPAGLNDQSVYQRI